jgi:hypothetical protein
MIVLFQILHLRQQLLDRLERVERDGDGRGNLDQVWDETPAEVSALALSDERHGRIKTHYIPRQNPSSAIVFLMQSIAPSYCGLRLDNPATCSFRRRTSKGCVNNNDIAPDKAPLDSLRTARLASETLGSWVISAGRMYVLTRVSFRPVSGNDVRTTLVDVKVERD